MALTNQFTAGQDLTAEALNASSIPVVSSTSDITTPFTGQLIFNTTDNRMYRYSGSAWVVYIGGHTWQVRRAAAQTIGNVSFTAVNFDTDDNDTGNFHSTVTNTDRVTIGQAGLYAVAGKAGWAVNGTGTRYADLTLNGNTIAGSSARGPNGGTDLAVINICTLYLQLALNDILRMRVWQNSGGNLDTAGVSFPADNCLMTGAWLHE